MTSFNCVLCKTSTDDMDDLFIHYLEHHQCNKAVAKRFLLIKKSDFLPLLVEVTVNLATTAVTCSLCNKDSCGVDHHVSPIVGETITLINGVDGLLKVLEAPSQEAVTSQQQQQQQQEQQKQKHQLAKEIKETSEARAEKGKTDTEKFRGAFFSKLDAVTTHQL